MPRLVEGSEVSAYLSPRTRLGLGTRGDAKSRSRAAAATTRLRPSGSARSSAGEGFVSLGTSGVIFSVTDRYVSLPERTLHAFCHALPGRWHGMSVMLAAASSLSWAAELIGRGDEIGAIIDGAEAFARSPDSGRLGAGVPALSQRRAHAAQRRAGDGPVRRAHRRAIGQDALIYAVLEGVAFSFADGTDVLAEAGARPVTPLLVGGGARSGFWGQLISDATGLTIDVAAGAEAGAALGAARLGMLAAGAGDIKTICARPATQRQFVPRPEARRARSRRGCGVIARSTGPKKPPAEATCSGDRLNPSLNAASLWWRRRTRGLRWLRSPAARFLPLSAHRGAEAPAA